VGLHRDPVLTRGQVPGLGLTLVMSLVLIMGLVLLPAGVAAADLSTHGSVGPGHGVDVPGGGGGPRDVLHIYYDGSAENGYCWQYGGIAPPYYGAFAECYHFSGWISGIELKLTGVGMPCRPCDLYVWSDGGGVPGNVLSLTTNANPCPIATWPDVSTHDLPISATWVDDPFWVGYWADFTNQYCGYFVAADLDGPSGSPVTNVAPGIGYPTGWQSVDIIWGDETQNIGIGVWEGEPTGACCFADGHCTMTPVQGCGGQFLGAGTDCDPNPCSLLSGACCLHNGECRFVPWPQCPTGDWRSEVPCDPNPCPPPPIGACCVASGCSLTAQSVCPGGWLGPGSTCQPDPCPNWPGYSDCIDYPGYLHRESVVELPSRGFTVAVSGNLACVAVEDYGLVVVDVTDPQFPFVTGSLETADHAGGIAVSGNFAYLTTWNQIYYGQEWGDLLTIDISDPSHPTLVASTSIGPSLRVAVSGSHVYAATFHDFQYSGDLLVFDLANPASPQIVGSVRTSGEAFSLAVWGNHVYVGAAGLDVIDVSDPQRPTIVGHLPGTSELGLAAWGHYAFISGDAVSVVDVSVPEDPHVVSSAPVDCLALAADGNYVYGSGFHAIDVSDPLNPRVVGNVPMSGTPFGVAVSGGHAYVASSEFHVIDISNPASPPILGSADTPGQASGVSVSGACAYVADGTAGLQVIDVAEPQNPQISGAADTPGQANGVDVSGAYAYVADEGSGLQVITVEDPRNPAIVGSADTPGPALGVAVSGHYAFVADGSYTLEVIDVTDPQAPNLVGGANTPGHANAVEVSGGYAYVAAGSAGLEIFDISDPPHPVIVGSAGTPGYPASGVAVSGSYAYLAAGAAFQVIDVSDPRSPQIVYSSAQSATGVAVSGIRAYVTGSGQVQVFDLSDPVRPWRLGSAGADGPGVTVAGTSVYVAGGDAGLIILPAECDPTGTPAPVNGVPASGLSVYPNPTSRQATARFVLPAEGRVRASIHDVAGRRVRSLYDGLLGRGPHDLLWDGRDDAGREVGVGIYLARVRTAEGAASARVVILR
jgi:hypothetical protein